MLRKLDYGINYFIWMLIFKLDEVCFSSLLLNLIEDKEAIVLLFGELSSYFLSGGSIGNNSLYLRGLRPPSSDPILYDYTKYVVVVDTDSLFELFVV